ncbi:hypothetical protein A2U01_0024983, partial [Trifolium medium]|nr:hypothetical protein [Trifolium medium]
NEEEFGFTEEKSTGTEEREVNGGEMEGDGVMKQVMIDGDGGGAGD